MGRGRVRHVIIWLFGLSGGGAMEEVTVVPVDSSGCYLSRHRCDVNVFVFI